MKLIIQIPCYNEEGTLEETLRDLPEKLQGFDVVEWLVVNDGSNDRTVEVARRCGVHHIVSHSVNRGLARAFVTGIEACLERGADVIVNTDADNQYCAADIPALVKPILDGKADMVVGARPIKSIEHFSPMKKLLQKLGSWLVRVVSRTSVQDAPSGFRAFSRTTAQQFHVLSSYTYTLETLIQAGLSGLTVMSVPIRTNAKTRESRLIRSIPTYVRRSLFTILRILITYRPFSFFTICGFLFFTPGFFLGLRFLIAYLEGLGRGMIQSLILSSLLMLIGVLLFAIAILADLIAVNRRLIEKTRWQIYKLEDRVSRFSNEYRHQKDADV